MLQAVLTGDIVNSTLLEPAQEKKLIKLIESVLAPHLFEFYRGDSFQVYQKQAGDALKTALLCRTAAIALMPEGSPNAADVRISIGIGDVVTPVKSLATAKGEAFLLSGRTFDDLGKTEGRLIMAVENKIAAAGLAVMSDYINSIFKQMTEKQAEVIFELLNGNSQQQVAEKLNKSKSTISQHVSSGRWDEIERILVNYKKIVQLVSL